MSVSWEKFKSQNADSMKTAAKYAREALGEDAVEYEELLKDTDRLKPLFNMISQKDMEKVSSLMSDPVLIKKILSSPKARENLKKILGK